MADEARAMLDALMGADRDASLPEGAAVSKKRGGGGDGVQMRKKTKSCYDADVDPLYCAWGVDVFELFVNTKSDIGPNPRTVDDEARAEFLELPQHEQERLGFQNILFRKLSDLVRSCDRTVQRNKDKLAAELRRQNEKRGGAPSNDSHVTAIDPMALDALVRSMCQLERVEDEIESVVDRIDDAKRDEEALQDKVEEERRNSKAKEGAKANGEKDPAENGNVKGDDAQERDAAAKKEEDNEETPPEATNAEDAEGGVTIEVEDAADAPTDAASSPPEGASPHSEQPPQPSELELKLRHATVGKQRLLFDLARLVQQYAPLVDRVTHETQQLQQVRSDITADKTVCEVSGNFMSARDADERIAAHYAGKQYVGWKLVRDKLKELVDKHGRYGPPPPQRGGGYGGGPPDRYGGPPRGGGGRHFGGRGGYDRRGPSSERWERGGPSGGYGGRGNRGGDDRRYGGGGGHYGGGWRR